MKKKNYVTYVLIIGILFAFFLSGCSSKQNSEVPLAETVGIPTAILFLWIVFGYVFLGAIFGVATLFVMKDKGYDKDTANKWAIAAFFLGSVPFIAACAKTNLNILNAIKNISSNNSNNTESSKNNTNNSNNKIKSTTMSEKPTICCPECGAPNPIGTQLCEECGANLSKIN